MRSAPHMRWHREYRRPLGVLSHPYDGEAWKHFDNVYPDFASEPRNVRLGLCADGFTPFSNVASPYSCWPVFLTLYNLPPEMCMTSPYIFLSCVIPERISHDTHLFDVPLVRRILVHIILIIVDHSVFRLPHRHCLHSATRTYLYKLFIDHNPYRQVGYRMVLHLPQHFVHPGVSPSSTDLPSATPDDEMPALALARRTDLTMCTWESKYNLVIPTTVERRESARLSSWLKKVQDTDQHPGWMLPHVFDELCLYWNTDKLKAMSEQAKKARGSLKDGSLHTRGADTVGTITRELVGSNSNF
ncbi:hypothetical protein MTR67_043430 [Solanum verrucosum]|uniref:Uncharacterized protein n=1 Tax=Solanum verrucosum TaxID=315347 RepID=A0AAF0ZUP7_SOLVR|nr:hypothetical protein MTR67_043430 [Solanum verrucosum]